ncbi:MAG TPA: FKBP-type peptidyl-prolyl cis-trans isomerase [Steroidobacteraceae bacterium]|nr:FKBP-type peptidyl-prolyl cis-trans isomerase [Steroidobacteraceae bacterium]
MKQHTSRLVRRLGLFGVVLAVAPLVGAQTPPPATAAPPAQAAAPAAPPSISSDQASYLFGLTFGEQLRSIGASGEVNADAVSRGVKDGLQGKKSTQTDKQQVQEYARAMMTAFAARNKTAGQEFLAHNAKEPGIKTTESGLQYKVLTAGDAKAPLIASSDQVTVNYRGTLIDGTEFDSSFSRGQPATFGVSGVIKGWQEALVMMKPGARWQLFVPAELAYGPGPRPGIPANSVLIFEVEVLSAKANGAPAANGAMPPSPPPPHKPVAPTSQPAN